MRVLDRPALIRLVILLLLLGGAGFSAWWIMIRMPFESYDGPLPPLNAEQQTRDVARLAGEIGERNVFSPVMLRAAADYIESELLAAGYVVTSQRFDVRGVECRNLAVEIRVNPARTKLSLWALTTIPCWDRPARMTTGAVWLPC
jgi:hypothetical protein